MIEITVNNYVDLITEEVAQLMPSDIRSVHDKALKILELYDYRVEEINNEFIMTQLKRTAKAVNDWLTENSHLFEIEEENTEEAIEKQEEVEAFKSEIEQHEKAREDNSEVEKQESEKSYVEDNEDRQGILEETKELDVPDGQYHIVKIIRDEMGENFEKMDVKETFGSINNFCRYVAEMSYKLYTKGEEQFFWSRAKVYDILNKIIMHDNFKNQF